MSREGIASRSDGPLFDAAKARARAVDPDTSKAAAVHVTRTGKAAAQVRQAEWLVQRWPGYTCRELAEFDLDRAAYEWLHKRLPECRGVRKGEPRKCRVTGRQAATWWPAQEEI